MKLNALSVELDWNPADRPGEGRVILRWAGRLGYVWAVTDREAAWLSEDDNLDQWFAEKLDRLFEHVFGSGFNVPAGTPAIQPAELETHTCAWEYVPRYRDGVEEPRWRCAKRWSDGEQCTSEVANPDTVLHSVKAVKK